MIIIIVETLTKYGVDEDGGPLDQEKSKSLRSELVNEFGNIYPYILVVLLSVPINQQEFLNLRVGFAISLEL